MTVDPQDLVAGFDDESADVGCSAGFELLHRYVELGLSDGDPADEFPGLATHLRRCPACRTDYEGLVALAEQFGDADPR